MTLGKTSLVHSSFLVCAMRWSLLDLVQIPRSLKETHTKNTYAKNVWAKSKVTRTFMLVNKEDFFVHFVAAAAKL